MRRSRLLLLLPFLLLAGLLTSAFLSGAIRHPEQAILGKWKETSWTYELVHTKLGEKDKLQAATNPTLEHDVFNQLIIHQSEEWNFGKQSLLLLDKQKRKPVNVNWKLKGRGHILQLTYTGGATEYYQIKELTDTKMVLHFENELHAKGIVKIEFTRQ